MSRVEMYVGLSDSTWYTTMVFVPHTALTEAERTLEAHHALSKALDGREDVAFYGVHNLDIDSDTDLCSTCEEPEHDICGMDATCSCCQDTMKRLED